jgi:hypothetical protein
MQRGTQCGTTNLTPNLNDFQTQFTEEGALERVMFIFPTAKHAIEPPTEEAVPASRHKPRVISSKPLIRSLECLALLVGSESSCGGSAARRGARSTRLGFTPNNNKVIHEAGISKDGINSGQGD